MYCARSYIPEGTAVSAHFYSIQRDPRNFSPGAEIFWPERWLIAENKEYVALPSSPASPITPDSLNRPKDFVHNMDAFVPFSYGPANCVGKLLALKEMKTGICYIMQKLEMRFAEGYDTRKWFDGILEYAVLRKGSLPVVVRRRARE